MTSLVPPDWVVPWLFHVFSNQTDLVNNWVPFNMVMVYLQWLGILNPATIGAGFWTINTSFCNHGGRNRSFTEYPWLLASLSDPEFLLELLHNPSKVTSLESGLTPSQQISQYLRSTLNRVTKCDKCLCPSKINGSHYPGALKCQPKRPERDLAGDGSPASALPAALYYLAWADKRSAPTKGSITICVEPIDEWLSFAANLRISEALHFNWMSWKCKIQAPNANLVTLGFCAQRYIKATSLANMLNPC